MKKILIVLFVFLILAFAVAFFFQTKPILTIENKRISRQHIEMYKQVYLKVNSIDSIYSTSIAYEMIKDELILRLCSLSGIDISDSTIGSYDKMLRSDTSLSLFVDSLNILFGEENVYRYFLVPFISKNLLSDMILSDNKSIQKDRYAESAKIFGNWTGKDCDNIFLSPNTEYFLQHLSDEGYEEHQNINLTPSKQMYEDNVYYYVALKENNIIKGYRTKKVTFDEFALQFKRHFDIKFADKSYERAFLLLSEETIWKELINIK